MFHKLLTVISVVSFFSACGAAPARCTDSAQCPAGTTCDVAYGLCIEPVARDAGSGFSLNGEYGKACRGTSECASGQFCTSIGSDHSACLASAPNCPASTVNYMNMVCVRPCATSGDCHSSNDCVVEPNLETKVCLPKGAPASEFARHGAACTANADCRSDATCFTNFPRGYCSRQCSTSSDCHDDGVCVTGTSAGSLCMAKCTPGAAGACRPGYTCASSSAGAVCIPQ